MAEVVTNTNISDILASDLPVMIDFWAPWCGPCRMLAPTVDAVETEYAGRVVVAKCNVDDADEASMQFRIRNIPTLLFFKGGEMVNRLVGAVSKQEITAILDSLI
ncbi:MAG: thioredoxin [Bacteroidales bacterium]|jgi:thioredoxin 1|nr:thioredoxin [Bacteroidales bacterium]MBR4818358.1 thioredoxin [Bacteroidales bacterium]MBR5054631.1 thioredoxin [Bacteroidales bacterium]